MDTITFTQRVASLSNWAAVIEALQKIEPEKLLAEAERSEQELTKATSEALKELGTIQVTKLRILAQCITRLREASVSHTELGRLLARAYLDQTAPKE